MIDSELKKYVETLIESKMNIVLHAVAGATGNGTETIQQLFPGQEGIKDRPVVHPYGFASRAKTGTISVSARVGNHPGNRIVIGHRDNNRPTVKEGETSVYSSGKYEIRVQNDKVMVGKNGSFQPLVVGDDLTAVLIALIDAILDHTHIGNLGAPTSPPQNASVFQNIEDTQVKNDKLLATDGGKF